MASFFFFWLASESVLYFHECITIILIYCNDIVIIFYDSMHPSVFVSINDFIFLIFCLFLFLFLMCAKSFDPMLKHGFDPFGSVD